VVFTVSDSLADRGVVEEIRGRFPDWEIESWRTETSLFSTGNTIRIREKSEKRAEAVKLGKMAINAPRSQARDDRLGFVSFFDFDPEKFSDEVNQKEALIRLAQQATQTRAAAKALNAAARLQFMQSDEAYSKSSLTYLRMRDLFEIYAPPELKQKLPHWTEFPKLLSQWVEGKVWEDFFPS
jgi:hypothetical protein